MRVRRDQPTDGLKSAADPNRYAALRDVGFRRLKTNAGEKPKIEVDGVTMTFTVDGKTLDGR